jgi:hypothetical protein
MSQHDEATARRQDEIPETIDNDWDRFYLEYPDIYDRFAISTPPVVAAAHDLIDYSDKIVIANGTAPGWQAGELTDLLLPELDPGGRDRDHYMERLGFAYQDIDVDGDYGSVEEAVATYGFIYRRKAID